MKKKQINFKTVQCDHCRADQDINPLENWTCNKCGIRNTLKPEMKKTKIAYYAVPWNGEVPKHFLEENDLLILDWGSNYISSPIGKERRFDAMSHKNALNANVNMTALNRYNEDELQANYNNWKRRERKTATDAFILGCLFIMFLTLILKSVGVI